LHLTSTHLEADRNQFMHIRP